MNDAQILLTIFYVATGFLGAIISRRLPYPSAFLWHVISGPLGLWSAWKCYRMMKNDPK